MLKNIALALGLLLSASLFAESDSKSESKVDAESGSFKPIRGRMYYPEHIRGVAGIKINPDSTVTVSEAEQSSLAKNHDYDLRDGKGMKKKSVTLKAGEEFMISINNNSTKRYYKLVKIDDEHLFFDAHYVYSKKEAERLGYDDSNWSFRIDPYGAERK